MTNTASVFFERFRLGEKGYLGGTCEGNKNKIGSSEHHSPDPGERGSGTSNGVNLSSGSERSHLLLSVHAQALLYGPGNLPILGKPAPKSGGPVPKPLSDAP